MRKELTAAVALAAAAALLSCGRAKSGWQEPTAAEMESLLTEHPGCPAGEIAGSVIFDDRAQGMLGAVLLKEDGAQIVNVVFVEEDGGFQNCGICGVPEEEPRLTYGGDCSVTFQMAEAGGGAYTCRVTCTVDGNRVGFIREDMK